MGLMNLFDNKKRFTIMDVASDEVAMIALAFLIAKFFPQVLVLDWYWYVVVIVLAVIKPIRALLEK